ncbi:MAG: peroxiredoxin family protein [Planctomycetota bacterium]
MKTILTVLLTSVAFGSVGLAADPPKVGDVAKDFKLVALDGSTTQLTKLTKQGPVALIVLRGYPGYQCPICTTQFAEFRAKAEGFRKLGANVVFVYPGPADKLKDHASAFVKGKDYPEHFQFVLDPDYALTSAYGLRWDARGETAYPSTFVIDADNRIRFAAISKGHGGRTKAADVLKAIPQ